jgi:hypothetical protein
MAVASWPPHRRPVPRQQWLFLYLNAVLERLQPFMPVTSECSKPEAAAATVTATTEQGLPELLSQIAYTLAYMNILPVPAWRAQLFLVVTGQLPHFSPNQAVHMLHAMALWRMGASAQRFSAAPDAAASSTTAATPVPAGVDYPAPLVDALAVLAGGPAGMRDLKRGSRRILPQSLKALGWPGDQELVESNLDYIKGALAHLQVCLLGSHVCCSISAQWVSG